MITVVIKTCGRETLGNAIESALREKFPVIVVGDGDEYLQHGFNVTDYPDVKFFTTGRKWGHYGQVAGNVGAFMTKTPYFQVSF